MPRNIAHCVLLLLVMEVPLLCADDLPPLTNDSILQMRKLTDASIIAVIDSNEANFDLSPDAISKLSGSGISEKVLSEMWSANLRTAKKAAPVPAAPAAAPAPAAPAHTAAPAPPPAPAAAAAHAAAPARPAAPAAASTDKCSKVAKPATQSCPVPTLSISTSNGKTTYSGTLPNVKSGAVRICVNDVEQVKSMNSVSGKFQGDSNGLKLDAGSVLVAQALSCGADKKEYGPISVERVVGKCSAGAQGDQSVKTTLDAVEVGSLSVSGTTSEKGGTVRICVSDAQDATATADVDGKFIAQLSAPASAGQSVSVQAITSIPGDFPRDYGPSASVNPKSASNGFVAEFIGGVEQAGYSSQANNTNGFLSASFKSPYWIKKSAMSMDLAFGLWGRIRLLSGPLPSSVNVVAALTNPTGTITSSNLSSVGQVVDYVFGPEFRIKQWPNDKISFVLGTGATTPLASNQVQYSFTPPKANTPQCLQLVAEYPKFLTNGSTPPACNLINPVTNEAISTLVFAAQDRTNFLMKYGGGFRVTHTYPAKDKQPAYSGTVDFILSQDQSITGGIFRGPVFRVDGVYPIAFSASPYVYLFGSASMKLTKNQFSYPIVLATATSPTLPLATNVALLPLTQPNRDFYRFGVGLNILAIFSKMGSNTPTTKGQTGAPSSDGSASAPNDLTQTALAAKY